VLLTCKNVSPKKDSPISKKYQHLQVDPLPTFETFKKLKSINRHKNSNNKVANTVKCPRCNAPHHYIYDNNGGRGQYLCKICKLIFEANKNCSKSISFKCPYCNKTLEKNKIRKDFNIYKCKNNYCYFYQYNFAKMIKDAKKLFKTKPFKFKFRYTYLEFKCDIIPLSKKSPVIPKVDLSKIYFSPHTLGKTILYSEWYPF